MIKVEYAVICDGCEKRLFTPGIPLLPTPFNDKTMRANFGWSIKTDYFVDYHYCPICSIKYNPKEEE